MSKHFPDIAVVIPNWNGMDSLAACLDSLLAQTAPCHIIVVENGSTDGSLEFLRANYAQTEILVNKKNLGFDGGVNTGIRQALKAGFPYIALLNNDAYVDKNWARHLVDCMEQHPETGIATSKILSSDGKKIDSTGDYYTVWGLPYPRGRGESETNKYDQLTNIFGASGGASIFRASVFEQIGIFDEDFFAYYEDVDISFRAQLGGWKVRYVPEAVVYHQIGMTSGKIKGFTTYQTMKNLPWVLWKNVPRKFLPTVVPRFYLAYMMFFGRAILRGQGWAAAKGYAVSLAMLPKKLKERRQIQRQRTVTDKYVWEILVHDLPPNAFALRKLRALRRKFTGGTAS